MFILSLCQIVASCCSKSPASLFCLFPVDLLSHACCWGVQFVCHSPCLPRSDPPLVLWQLTSALFCVISAGFLQNWTQELWLLNVDRASVAFVMILLNHHKKKVFMLSWSVYWLIHWKLLLPAEGASCPPLAYVFLISTFLVHQLFFSLSIYKLFNATSESSLLIGSLLNPYRLSECLKGCYFSYRVSYMHVLLDQISVCKSIRAFLCVEMLCQTAETGAFVIQHGCNYTYCNTNYQKGHTSLHFKVMFMLMS